MTDQEKLAHENTVAIARLTTVAESTSKDVDKLVKIVENDICTKGHCKDISKRLEVAEEDIKAIKSIPNKILWRVSSAVIGIVTLAILANYGITTKKTDDEATTIKDLKQTIKTLELNQIRNHERQKIQREYKVKVIN